MRSDLQIVTLSGTIGELSCTMLTYTVLSLCFISFVACLKQCINYCAKDDHAYDGAAIESVSKPVGFCVLLCQSMDECEGFDYDSAVATCHLINSAYNLTAAAGITAWSMKLCAGMYNLLPHCF